MKIVILLPYANPHVTGWVKEIGKKEDVEVSVGIVESVRKFRVNYFQNHDEEPSFFYFFKGKKSREAFLQELRKADIFVSLGIFNSEFLKSLIHLPRKVHVFIISEPFNPVTSKNNIFIRRMFSLIVQKILNGRCLDFFAIGGLAVKKYYSSLGFKESLFYNFGYFPELHRGEWVNKVKRNEINFLFVGQLIKRKGIEILEEAIKYLDCHYLNWRFTIVGDGAMREKVESFTTIYKNVEYVGLVNESNRLRNFYSNADILFLPSYFDGWGAVINEGIAQGCSLLVSRNVFASNALLKEGRNGFSFDPYQIETLFPLLDKYFSRTDFLTDHKVCSYEIYNEWNYVNAAESVNNLFHGRAEILNNNLLKVI